MKLNSISLLTALTAICLQAISSALVQDAPDVIWEVVTPSGLANSIQGVGWSPGASGRVAVGSTDRWVRTRQASNGALVYSVLQPHRSGGADQTIYSSDGGYLAVHNRSGGAGYRVHRAADGVFLGTLTTTIEPNDIVRFAPDAQLLAAVGGDGTMSLWRLAEFTVGRTVGSGYQRVSTAFNFSPSGAYQSAASQGSIKIQRHADGSVVRILAGGSVVAFTPDSAGIAAWTASPNQTTLWRISDGALQRQFPGATGNEGVGAIRFTPDRTRLVTTGYLPFVDADGLWQQVGVIRFWRIADGALRNSYHARTGIAVTSPVAWSPNATAFVYGTYEGTAVVALTPAP